MKPSLKSKYADILIRPRVTEKATFVSAANVYTFEIAPIATKKQVAEAIKSFYKVSPIKINIVRNPAKEIFVRGKKGRHGGVKKAYVYLKEGDKIE